MADLRTRRSVPDRTPPAAAPALRADVAPVAHTTDLLRPWAAVATELLAIQAATECLTVLHRDGLVTSSLYDSPTTNPRAQE